MNKNEDPDTTTNYCIAKVSAGFPSPADDYLEKDLNLDNFLIKNRPSTFLIRAGGDSMINVGIYEGDILVVDRSIEAKNKDIIVAVIFGELTVKKIIFKEKKEDLELHSANPTYPNIKIKNKEEFTIWGVVTFAIHQFIK
ncbi:MAG: DNA polymerase V [Pelagibacteraceae bacterium]|nr:DNA polymerase V [Pelagibacteraceae bacterium]|tara:strand:- start:111 stop:530 length:420 start_codon:yes stop_codon:yes gene_type:complete